MTARASEGEIGERGSGEPAVASGFVLLSRAGGRICLLPLGQVIETLRPLALEPFAGSPELLLGLSIVRGAPVPVFDLARLFDAHTGHRCSSWVSVRLGERRAVFAVDEVIGVRSQGSLSLAAPSPLLDHLGSGAIEALGSLDRELLLLLDATRVVPESVWSALETEEAL